MICPQYQISLWQLAGIVFGACRHSQKKFINGKEAFTKLRQKKNKQIIKTSCLRKHKGNHNVLCRDLLFSVCLFVIFVFLLFFSSWVIHDFVIFVQIGFFSVFWYPAFLSIGAFSCFVNSQLFASKFRFLTKLSNLFHYFIIDMENLQLPTAGFHSNHSIFSSEAQKKEWNYLKNFI